MQNNLLETKRKILGILRFRGPSLPVHIAKQTGLDMLFSSALLSELAAEKEIKISDLKVGGSPLYFLRGQEARLEEFSKFLPSKEKEAFILLKKKTILDDKKQNPAIRVALRNIKDFAFPIILDIGKEKELFWRLYSLPEEEARASIKLKEKAETKPVEKVEIKLKPEKKELKEVEKPILELEPQKIQKIIKPVEKIIKPVEKTLFVKKITSLLNSGNIELLEEKEIKKKEFLGVVKISSQLGQLKFLCIAKDKKRITENDFTLAVQKSNVLKMPILFLSPGEPNKKALLYLEENSGLINFKRIKE